MVKRNSVRSIGRARHVCKGKKGTALKSCMRKVMKGGKTGVKKRKKVVRRKKRK